MYTRFSQGQMTLGEIYLALVYGLIDPGCFPSMAVIHHDKKIWCTDTRRLTLVKQMERQGKWDVLSSMRIHRVASGTSQYKDFVTNRLPALQRRGFDGLTVQVSDQKGPTCCFDSSHRFRVDLEDHIIRDHLRQITLREFSDLTEFQCDMCHKATRISCTKSKKASFYMMIRKCGCQPKDIYQCTKPWLTMTLRDLCNEFRRYKNASLLTKAKVVPPPKLVSKPVVTLPPTSPPQQTAEKSTQTQSIPPSSIQNRDPPKEVRTPSIAVAVRIPLAEDHYQRPLIPPVRTSNTWAKHTNRRKRSRCTIS